MAKITVAGFIKTFLSAVDAAAARVAIGLGNVNNTSDANKPVSTAQQAALDLKANLASPALTGTPTAPTPGGADDSTKLATTAFVKAVIAGKLTADPAELALLLEEDPELLRSAMGVAQDPSPDGANGIYVGTDGVRFRGIDGDGRLKASDRFFTFYWNPDGASPELPFWQFDNGVGYLPAFTFSGTADRIFTFPDKSGTVALLSDSEISGEVLIAATTVIDSTHMGKRLRNISGMTQGLVFASPTTGTEGKSFVVDARTNAFTFSGAAPIGPAGAVATAPAGGMYVVRAVDGAWMISGLTSSQVMLLTGDQTAAGQKTFSTSPISTGTPTLGTHMLNRDQVDARYGQRLFAELASDSAPVVSSTNYADTGLELTLSAGVWEVFALVAVESANSAAGGRLRLAADASVDWHLLSIAPQAAPNQIRCTRELSSGTSTAVATCVLTSGTVSSLNLQGTVRAAGTILLKAQITQWSSDPGTTVAKARSMLIARKIG